MYKTKRSKIIKSNYLSKKFITSIAIVALSVSFLMATVIQKSIAGKGGRPKPPPLYYLAGYTPLSDGEGIYDGTNTRPTQYDLLAPTVTSPAKVNVIGASTAQLFLNAILSLDTSNTQWGDCAYGMRTAEVWADPNNRVWGSCDRDGFNNPDVVVIKTADSSLNLQNDINSLQATINNTFNHLPTLKQIYLMDEGWLGYGDVGEPYGFQHGLAIKQVVLNRIAVGTKWVSWGVYLWANGLGPDLIVGGQPGRSDGLEWTESDYTDGLHQSTEGAIKQVNLFLQSLSSDPVASQWYHR